MGEYEKKLEDRCILLGISGGISAYKSAELASQLTQAGAEVNTVMTENACRMIGPRTLQAITRNPVYTTMWGDPQQFIRDHTDLAGSSDIAAVVPATANIIAKAANGICDDLLSTLLCAAWEKPTVYAPAMNTHMWNNPAVQKNVKTLADYGRIIAGPETGHLACGYEGTGRMSEPDKIFSIICEALSDNR